MSGDSKTDENVIVKDLFEGIINALKSNQISSIKGLPRYAINLYYKESDRHFDLLGENFIEEYVDNESLVEGVHNKVEKEGLKAIYEYIFSNYTDSNVDIDYLLKLQ